MKRGNSNREVKNKKVSPPGPRDIPLLISPPHLFVLRDGVWNGRREAKRLALNAGSHITWPSSRIRTKTCTETLIQTPCMPVLQSNLGTVSLLLHHDRDPCCCVGSVSMFVNKLRCAETSPSFTCDDNICIALSPSKHMNYLLVACSLAYCRISNHIYLQSCGV